MARAVPSFMFLVEYAGGQRGGEEGTFVTTTIAGVIPNSIFTFVYLLLFWVGGGGRRRND